jgi:predicted aminopeptidase
MGCLDDQVMGTFVRYPDPRSRLIFHELAHRVVTSG